MKIATCSLVGMVALAVSANASVTLSQWDTLGQPGSQASSAGIGSANITAGDLARGAGLTGTAAANSISASGWNNQTTDYFSFGFTVASGFSANLDSLYIGSRSSGTGPGTLGLYYSGDGYSTNLFTFNQAPGANFVNSIVSLSGLTGLTGNVEFRIAQIGSLAANGGATSSNGTFRLTGYFANGAFDRNLQITGEVVPAPASLALLGLGGLAAIRRRR